MKKIVLLFLILMISACGKEQVDTDQKGVKGTKQLQNQDKAVNKKDRKNRKGRKGKKGKGDEKVIINVEAEKIVTSDALSVFKTTTLLAADLESDVTSKSSGIVLQINVEVGDKIEAGEVLAVLESDVQQLRMQSATANYQKSMHNYDRAKTLLKKGLANQESVDNLKFETRSLKTSLDQAQLDVEFTQIKAPISGVITQRNIKKGNLIQVNTAVYNIVDFDSLQAIINVPENKWGLFKQGLTALFDFASFDRIVTGKILRIDPVVDSSTGTFKVVLSLDKAGSNLTGLRPGLFGKTKIVLDKHANVPMLSKNALIREDDKSYVFIINDDKSVSKTTVTLGYEMDDSIEVLTGLSVDQQVVTTGKNNVSEDSKVEVIDYND